MAQEASSITALSVGPQARRMWAKIGKVPACGWRHPKSPSAKHLWKDKATEAVLEFLKGTRVGCLVTVRRLPREEEGEGKENEEDGPGPP